MGGYLHRHQCAGERCCCRHRLQVAWERVRIKSAIISSSSSSGGGGRGAPDSVTHREKVEAHRGWKSHWIRASDSGAEGSPS